MDADVFVFCDKAKSNREKALEFTEQGKKIVQKDFPLEDWPDSVPCTITIENGKAVVLFDLKS